MHVTLVFPDWVDAEQTIEQDKKGHGVGRINFAISMLSAELKASGHTVDLIHICHRPREKEFKDLLEQYRQTGLFGFSFSEVEAEWVLDMNRWIKQTLKAKTIGGGIFPTLCPEEALRRLGLDMICVGEGDRTLVELCSCLESGGDLADVPNLAYLGSGEYVRTQESYVAQDLDSLPRYDLDIYRQDRLKIFASNLPRLQYLCTRNCAFNCAFCSNHAKRKALAAGSCYVRRFSPRRVIDDLKYFKERYNFIKLIHFADEVIHHDKAWFRELMTLYVAEIGLPWRSYAMLSILDEETADIMAWSGCARVNCGIEAGSPRMRRLYNRPAVKNETLVAKVAMLRERGIDVHTSTLLGGPSETLDEMLSTLKLVARLDSEIAVTGIVVPYKGTKLHRLAQEQDLLLPTKYENLGVSIRPVDCSPHKVLFLFHAYRLIVLAYRVLMRHPLLEKLLLPVVDWTLKSPLLPHMLLIAIKKRFFEGKLLNRAYRKTESRLGRQAFRLNQRPVAPNEATGPAQGQEATASSRTAKTTPTTD